MKEPRAKPIALSTPEVGAAVDYYFSADVETDGPIPGPFSMLSFALVYAGRFDGKTFTKADAFDTAIYKELQPISDQYEPEALQVNGLDRERLKREGGKPEAVMTEVTKWVRSITGAGRPVLVAYPLSFDWTWLYWYFIRYSCEGSPFSYSSCFDLKTAFAVKADIPIARAGRKQLFPNLRSFREHTHHALDDAKEQAEIFVNIFEWEGVHDRHHRGATRK